MADYNPSAPEIIGQEWVGIRNEPLQFNTAVSTFERGYSFTADPWFNKYDYADFYMDRPADQGSVQNKVHTVNVYPKGRETETGAIRRLLIEPNWMHECTQQGGGAVCGVVSDGPASLLSSGDAYFKDMSQSTYDTVSIAFAVKKYKDLLFKKRILGVNIVMNTTFNWQTNGSVPPTVTGDATPYYYWLAESIVANGQSPALDTTHAGSQTLAILAQFDTVRFTDQFARYTVGNINPFFGLATPPIAGNVFIRDWSYEELARFDNDGTTNPALRMQIWTGQNNFIPAAYSVLSLNYMRMEVIYCDETRVATGSRLQSQQFTIPGSNSVKLTRIFDPTNPPTLFQGDLTVTLSNGTMGWWNFSKQIRDHYYNQVRQLEAIDSVQGVQINWPYPMDSSAVGLTPTIEDTNLIPQLVIAAKTDPATNIIEDYPGAPATAVHVYGKAHAASAAPLQLLQGIYNPVPGQVAGSNFKYVRFYARHVSETADTNSELRLTTRLALPDPGQSNVLVNFDQNSANGWTGTSATLTLSNTYSQSGQLSGKLVASGTPSDMRLTSPQIPLLPNQQYYFSASVFSVGTTPGNVYWFGQLFDAAGNFLQTVVGGGPTITGGRWEQRNIIFTAPTTAAYCTMQIVEDTPGANGTVYFDQIQYNVVRVVEDSFVRTPDPVVADNFNRTVSGGWGTSDDGRVWTVTSASPSSQVTVAPGSGSINMPAGIQEFLLTTVPGVSGVTLDVSQTTLCTFTSATRADFGLISRFADTNNYYFTNVSINTATGITLTINKKVAGVTTQLSTVNYVQGGLGKSWLTRFDTCGSYLQAWVFPFNDPTNPVAYTNARDTALATQKGVGVRASSTNGNGFDNFSWYSAERMWQSWFGATNPTGHVWANGIVRVDGGVSNVPQVDGVFIEDMAPGGGIKGVHGVIALNAANQSIFGPTIWCNWANLDARVDVFIPAPTASSLNAGLIFTVNAPGANLGTQYRISLQQTFTGSQGQLVATYFDGASVFVLGTGSEIFNFNPGAGGQYYTIRVHYEAGYLFAKAWQTQNSRYVSEPPGWQISVPVAPGPGGSPGSGTPPPTNQATFSVGCFGQTAAGYTGPLPVLFEFRRFLAYAADSYLNTSAYLLAPTTPIATATAKINTTELAALDPVVDAWREVTLELSNTISMGDEGTLTFVDVDVTGKDAGWELLAVSSPSLSGYANSGVAPAINAFVEVPQVYRLEGYARNNENNWYAGSEPSRDQLVALNDNFKRTVASGWGTSDTGQAWSITAGTASNFSAGFYNPNVSYDYTFNGSGFVQGRAATTQTATITPDSQSVWPRSEAWFNVSLANGDVGSGDTARFSVTWPGPYGCGPITVQFAKTIGAAWTVKASTGAGQSQLAVATPATGATVFCYAWCDGNAVNIAVDNGTGATNLTQKVQQVLLLPNTNAVSGTSAPATASFSVDLTSSVDDYLFVVDGIRFGHTVFQAHGQGLYDFVPKNDYAALSWAPQAGPTYPVPYADDDTNWTVPATLFEDKRTSLAMTFAPQLPAVTGFTVSTQTQVLEVLNPCQIAGIYAPTALLYNKLSWPVNQQVLLDTFSRSVSGGWGTSGSYRSWDPIGPPAYSRTTGDGYAHLSLASDMLVPGQRVELDSWNCDIRYTVDATPQPATANQLVLLDTFTRTVVSGGWGTPTGGDTGPTWFSAYTPANASVSGGFGRHKITVANQFISSQIGTGVYTDSLIIARNVSPSLTPSGAVIETSIACRASTTNGLFDLVRYVLAEVDWQTAGTATLLIADSNGLATAPVTITGVTASQPIDIILQVQGTRVRAWAALTATGLTTSAIPLISTTTTVTTPGINYCSTYGPAGLAVGSTPTTRWDSVQLTALGSGSVFNGANFRVRTLVRNVVDTVIQAQWDAERNRFLATSSYISATTDYPTGTAQVSAVGEVSYTPNGPNMPSTFPGYHNSGAEFPINVRVQLDNTTLRLRYWNVEADEPEFWQLITYLPNMALPLQNSYVVLAVDNRTQAVANGSDNYIADVKYSNLSVTDGKATAVEIQRQDSIDTDWKTIYKSDNPFISTFNDYEARIGIPTSYRARYVSKGEFPGVWSTVLSTTLLAPGVSGVPAGHVLTFTSNNDQTGNSNLAYSNGWEGGAVIAEPFTYPEAGFTQYQLMYGKDFYTAFSPLERGGDQFTRDIVVQAAAVSPETVEILRSLRDLAWDQLPYVCVRDENGNRWLASISVPNANVRFYRTIYTATVNVTEVTDTPVPVDPPKPWES